MTDKLKEAFAALGMLVQSDKTNYYCDLQGKHPIAMGYVIGSMIAVTTEDEAQIEAIFHAFNASWLGDGKIYFPKKVIDG